MRDNRDRMIRFLEDMSGGWLPGVDVMIGQRKHFELIDWLTDKQLAEITRREIKNWWFARKLNRENRMRRHA